MSRSDMWQDNIKQYLKIKGMTQEDLAFEINLSQSAISGILTNKNKPRLDTLEAIAKVFRISLEELFSEYGPNMMQESHLKNVTIKPKSKRYLKLQLEKNQTELIHRVQQAQIDDLEAVTLLNSLSFKLFEGKRS